MTAVCGVERNIREVDDIIKYEIGGVKSSVSKLKLETTAGPKPENDEYLAKGYPVGSGVIEGACRSFVKDRLGQAFALCENLIEINSVSG